MEITEGQLSFHQIRTGLQAPETSLSLRVQDGSLPTCRVGSVTQKGHLPALSLSSATVSCTWGPDTQLLARAQGQLGRTTQGERRGFVLSKETFQKPQNQECPQRPAGFAGPVPRGSAASAPPRTDVTGTHSDPPQGCRSRGDRAGGAQGLRALGHYGSDLGPCSLLTPGGGVDGQDRLH